LNFYGGFILCAFSNEIKDVLGEADEAVLDLRLLWCVGNSIKEKKEK
jgi:hypothetical protein